MDSKPIRSGNSTHGLLTPSLGGWKGCCTGLVLFNRLSGTNDLTWAADVTVILTRQKCQEGAALLTATGRETEDAHRISVYTSWSLKLKSFLSKDKR